mmetsp:Transcript_33927/g.90444  ORF Transcript_33927/g.90444 Transcript_33927/m.90444 type:complete len:87 (+) Transcript_33927:35-295(+)
MIRNPPWRNLRFFHLGRKENGRVARDLVHLDNDGVPQRDKVALRKAESRSQSVSVISQGFSSPTLMWLMVTSSVQIEKKQVVLIKS